MAMQASSDAPRVLVVDDEAMLADLLSQALRHEGWETATAKDGLDALAKATSFHPDVVILDVQMPRMDGLETLERCTLATRSCRSCSSPRVTRSPIACRACERARMTT